jgi:hypothetical protein
MKKGVFFRLLTSIGILFFLIIIATIIPLAAIGKLSGGEFVGMLMFGVGLALTSNKAADAIDPEDWDSVGAFAKSLWSRSTIIFVITYPVIVVLFRVGIIDYVTFFGAANGLVTAVLAARHAGEKIAAKKEEAVNGVNVKINPPAGGFAVGGIVPSQTGDGL